MITIPLERVGRITRGPEAGQFILVRDDQERTGGFLVFQSSEPDIFSAPEVFDFWVEQSDNLNAFFSESDWNVEWQLQPTAS